MPARTLARWLDAGRDDDSRAVVMLDTRNAFEVEGRHLRGAIDPAIRSFGDFPRRSRNCATNSPAKRVVTFTTGGIRCEKAVLYMQSLGMEHVVQLDGGILRFAEEVGGRHYRGDCFVRRSP